MKLSEKIKNYRIENNLTQKELSEKLNVSRTLIAGTETDKIKGTVKFLTKLSDLSGKSITYWMDAETEKNYKTYEALDILLDAMIDSKMIKADGKIGDMELRLIKSVLEKEIVLKIKNSTI